MKGQVGEFHHDVDLEMKWENYAGVSLIKSTELLMSCLHDFALDAVVSSFQCTKADHPEMKLPDVVIMEYGFS